MIKITSTLELDLSKDSLETIKKKIALSGLYVNNISKDNLYQALGSLAEDRFQTFFLKGFSHCFNEFENDFEEYEQIFGTYAKGSESFMQSGFNYMFPRKLRLNWIHENLESFSKKSSKEFYIKEFKRTTGNINLLKDGFAFHFLSDKVNTRISSINNHSEHGREQINSLLMAMELLFPNYINGFGLISASIVRQTQKFHKMFFMYKSHSIELLPSQEDVAMINALEKVNECINIRYHDTLQDALHILKGFIEDFLRK